MEQAETLSDGVRFMREFLRQLSEKERVQVFAPFCTHCGTDDPQCQCRNEE